MTIALTVNGQPRTLAVPATTPLLYVLRNDLRLVGAKYGCGAARCGACKVILDGQDVPACVTPLSACAGRSVTTVEGLARDGRLHPLQAAFVELKAAQCGYCTAGMLMAAKALLDRTPDPSPSQIRLALANHLCRCGLYHRILAAVALAARRLAP